MGEGSGGTLEAKQEPFKADRCFQSRKLLWSASGISFLVIVPHTGEKIVAIGIDWQARETSVTTEYWTCCWQMGQGSNL